MKHQTNSRRNFLKNSVLATAGTIGLFSLDLKTLNASSVEDRNILPDDGIYKLPPLPYAYDAMEPWIDAQTMEIHYTKHHQAYVDKLNAALEKAPEYKAKPLESILSNVSALPDSIKTAVRNMGGGHWNHSFLWNILSPKKDQDVSGTLKDAIVAVWQSKENFIAEFAKQGVALFGSGWVWLVKDANGKLTITTTPNQDNPLMDVAAQKGTPVLGVDVWEHAYYLKHQNKRADYLQDIWHVMNWEKASALYAG